MKRSMMVVVATMALLTGAVRVGQDKDDEAAEDAPKQKTGNVYDDYKPFEIKKDFDDEPFIHQFRHAAALERALTTNATSPQEKLIYNYLKEKDKTFNLDWKNVEGPGTYDNDTPVYYRDQIFEQRNKTQEKLDKEKDKKEEQKKMKAAGPFPELDELHVPDSLRQDLVNKAWKKEMNKRKQAEASK